MERAAVVVPWTFGKVAHRQVMIISAFDCRQGDGCNACGRHGLRRLVVALCVKRSMMQMVFRILVTLGLLLVLRPAAALDPSQLLPAAQAFRPSLKLSADGKTVLASWQIADGYYLYRDRFRFTPDTRGLKLGAPSFPDGQIKTDEYFGRMVVYHHAVTARIPIEQAPSGSTLALTLNYQGCADAGVCYPPQSRTLTVATAASGAAGDLLHSLLDQGGAARVDTPPAARPQSRPSPAVKPAPGTGTSGPEGSFVSEQDRLAHKLLAERYWALPLFFGLGILLAFTPCTFPMIPILAGVIAGQGSALTPARALGLSLVYVLSMALVYSAVGVLAGLSGANLQIWFQQPWVVAAFSALFVVLALAMFGVFRLQLPAALQSYLSQLSSRQRGGRYAGAAIMGVLSALIVGPCVTPPLIGALSVVSLSGDAVLGGMALFALSLGLGLPLLIVGTSAGRLLPHAGAWMDTVRTVFGVLMLAVALYLLDRIVPPVVTLLLSATLLIICAVYLGALESPRGGWRTLGQGFGLVLLVYGVLMLVGVAADGRNPWQPLRGTSLLGDLATAPALAFQPVKSVGGLRQALAAAAGRTVMLDFYADWCVSCKELERYTFSDPRVREALAHTQLLRADVTADDAQDQALLRHFHLVGPPAILFFDHNGQERPAFRVMGYMSAKRFRNHLQLVLSSLPRPDDGTRTTAAERSATAG